MDYIQIGKTEDVGKGQMKSYSVNGKEILVANYQGKFFAIGGKCSHKAGDLVKGKLDGKVVTCPRHGSKFDITTGTCISGPKIGPITLKTADEPAYEVKVQDNIISIKI